MYSQRNRDPQLTWDTAQICLNGHVINRRYESWPTSNSPHCPKCGAKTITQCPSCNTRIRGGYVGGMPSSTEEKADPFCHQCGAAYPWTETSLSAAREYIRELDRLNDNEKGLLSRSLDDLVRETPNTPVAILRFKQLARKAGSAAADGLKSILVQVAVESAKRQIWQPTP
jgi:hypothetical protein